MTNFRNPRSLLLLPLLVAGTIMLTPQSLCALAGPGENPVQLRFAAMDAILHGNSKDALDLYETAIQEAREQYGESSTFLADLYYEAGTAALDSSQFPVAERYLTQAVKINPYSTMAKIKLAELYRLQEKPDEASRQFRQAVQINPTSPVTRQAYIRWLATNGRSTQENAIATQESLKLAMLNARSSEIIQTRSKNKQAGFVMPILSPALIAPFVSKSNKPEKPAKQENSSNAAEIDTKAKAEPKEVESKPTAAAAPVAKTDDKPKSSITLFPFKNLAKDKAAEKENEKQKQAQAKQDAERKAAEKESARQAEREREQEREKARSEREARRKASAAKKPAKVEKAEPKPQPKKVEEARPKVEKAAEPAVVPSAQPMYQPVNQSMSPTIYGIPTQVKKPTGKSARTMVPPPPPMPLYGGMPMPQPQQQMPMPMPQPTPKPVVKPKPKPTKAEVKEPEDKPPPMTHGPDDDSGFMLEWADVKNKKKGK